MNKQSFHEGQRLFLDEMAPRAVRRALVKPTDVLKIEAAFNLINMLGNCPDEQPQVLEARATALIANNGVDVQTQQGDTSTTLVLLDYLAALTKMVNALPQVVGSDLRILTILSQDRGLHTPCSGSGPGLLNFED